MKVWIYKGDILPYKVSIEDKITREAAMAVGETSGQNRPRRLITAGGGRRRVDQAEPGTAAADEAAETDGATEAAAERGGGRPAPDLAAEADGAGEAVTVEADDEVTEAPVADLIAPPAEPDDLERLLAEDEEIERRSRHEHHETPHFRRESD